MFVSLSDSVSLLVVVILLLVKIHSFYVHTSDGSWMILYVAKLILVILAFSHRS